MNPALIIPLVSGLANLVRELTPVVQSVIGNLKSDDQQALQAAIADLQAAVDAQHADTQRLLRGQ